MRSARHPGYDRIVFDLGGTGTPGWRVEYTTNPTYEGSGEPVTLQGTVFLQVILRGVGLTGAHRPFRVFALADPARVVVDVRLP